jgi:geranylgeranyl diphosphate synthase type II
MQGAKAKLNDHIDHAKSALNSLSVPSGLLVQICDMIAERDH